jgi:hypothetical protein
MKQHKIVNINVKVKLNRTPSTNEKKKLVETIAYILDSGEPHQGLYGFEFREKDFQDSLKVDHHYVAIRKMGIN